MKSFRYLIVHYGFLLIYLLLLFNFVRVQVRGNSMEPSLHDGDVLVGVRVFNADVGDIVCAYFPEGGSALYIKRVVAVNGDYVSFSRSGLYINGELVSDYYTMNYLDSFEGGTLHKGEYFLVGDNYEHSADSRAYGVVSRNQIKYLVFHMEDLCYYWIMVVFVGFLAVILPYVFDGKSSDNELVTSDDGC